jgi:hypothetical protein
MSVSKPATYNGDLANLPPALLPLTEKPRWCVWNWVFKEDRWTKPPFN